MSTSIDETTNAADRSTNPKKVTPWALVRLWSASEPGRVGEVAFLPFHEDVYLGRGDKEVHEFAHFGLHRPGERFAPAVRSEPLVGGSIAPRHVRLHATKEGVCMDHLGASPTLVNGVEEDYALLLKGDTVMLGSDELFLCTRRSRHLPGPRPQHAFGTPDAAGMVGESPAMCTFRERLAQIADRDRHTLLVGETGTGKALVAAFLHRTSKRAEGPWIWHPAGNLAPSSAGLKPAYPPDFCRVEEAVQSKGLVKAVEGGTLYLERLDECPSDAKAQLHTFLLGIAHWTGGLPNVRVISTVLTPGAMERLPFDLRKCFVDTIRMPPLGERREDIPLVIRDWLIQRAKRGSNEASRYLGVGPNGNPEPRLSAALVEYLVRGPRGWNYHGLESALLDAMEASHTDVLDLWDPPEPPSSR
jgi:Sigma-54 interaction domain